MSDGKPVRLITPLETAQYLVERLRYVCERIEIAGSIRRKQAFVHDIEIVCIPKTEPDLFGEPTRTDAGILDALKGMNLTWLKFIVNGPHNKRFFYNGLQVDLYITTPECWGVIYLIRTGSAEYAKCMVTRRQQGGMMPSNMMVKDGRVWMQDRPDDPYDDMPSQWAALDTPDEADVFALYGIKWMEPEERK